MIGRIYKITSPSTDKIYIGSTKNTLNRRFRQHKDRSSTCSSTEIINYGDAQIELLEEMEYQDRKELRWKEREYHERFKECCVNKIRAITTEDEEKKITSERSKKSYLNNREKIMKNYEMNREKRMEKMRENHHKRKAAKLAASAIA